MRRATEAIRSALRKLLKTTIALGVIVFVLLFVPIWPFFPKCMNESHDYEHIFRYMSDEYRWLVKYGFDQLGVYYWDIGGVMFVRVLPFLDGAPHFNQHDAIVNAEMQAAASLGNWSSEDPKLDGRTYQTPAFIRELVANHPSDYPYNKCDVMPYIISLRPPPAQPAQ